MFNINDLKVEQAIAQERYETIIRARQVDKARQRTPQRTFQPQTIFPTMLRWMGHQLVNLGCYLQRRRGVTINSVCR